MTIGVFLNSPTSSSKCSDFSIANIVSALMSVDAIVADDTKNKQTQVSSSPTDFLLFVRLEFLIVWLPFIFLSNAN
jgi:hypothetical protein